MKIFYCITLTFPSDSDREGKSLQAIDHKNRAFILEGVLGKSLTNINIFSKLTSVTMD